MKTSLAHLILTLLILPALFGGLAGTGPASSLEAPHLAVLLPLEARLSILAPLQAADPLIQPLASLTASDKQAEDMFGNSVAMDGNVIVVGAMTADLTNTCKGAAYVFVKTGADWSSLTQVAKLTTSDPAKGKCFYFGHSVAISGDVIVVGARWADSYDTQFTGAAYVFVKPAGGWAGDLTETAKLVGSDIEIDDELGSSVAISGDVVVAGAPIQYLIGNQENAGAAYVFVKPVGGWDTCPQVDGKSQCTQSAKLAATDIAANDFFGWSVAVDDQKIVVGAPLLDQGTGGKAYVFQKPAGGWSGNLTESAKLVASNKLPHDWFGWSVALAGNTVVVGARGWGDGAKGAVYVFERTPGNWRGLVNESAFLHASDAAGVNVVGDSVATDGNIVVAGVPTYHNEVALLFVRQPGGWVGPQNESAVIYRQDHAAGEDGDFGVSAALSGDAFVIGDDWGHPGDLVRAGAAYVFPNNYQMVTFADVLPNYWAWSFVERLYRNGVTGGCSTTPLKYCPETKVNRAQMAVFLLRSKYGATYMPPVATGTVFTDVPANYWAAAWIEQLAAEHVTGGCGSGRYCPETVVTRDQMAVFLLRAQHSEGYTPPPAVGSFADVPANYWAAAWIEQLAAEGITSGCGGGNYCPTKPVTRAQMAVFLAGTFNLP